jgi:glutamate formiminotransferase
MANPDWTPDYRPSAPHPTAGASIVGARGPLIAYNVNLATDLLGVARSIAVAIRESAGGLPCVKALGVRLAERKIVQVTTNLTNYRVTSVTEVFDAICREASGRGVEVVDSEFVGLVPRDALPPEPAERLRLVGFTARKILDL